MQKSRRLICEGVVRAAELDQMKEAPSIISGTRRLLRRLRDTMAGSGTAQERLDRIVRIVAAEMVAEVCSAYIMRAGEVGRAAFSHYGPASCCARAHA